jgi:hypothetical protein
MEVGKHMLTNTGSLHDIEVPKPAKILATKKAEPVPEASASVLGMRKFLRDNDCKDVYLDLGTNVGVQPRKLYQPECYPRALSLPHFERVFGRITEKRRRRVCTFGFEPNPAHAAYLDKLQNFLRALGHPVMFITRTAVTGKDMANATFYFDPDKSETHQVGASLIQASTSGKNVTKTHTMSLHSIMAEIKAYSNVNTLLMKVDMEGSEYEALPGE